MFVNQGRQIQLLTRMMMNQSLHRDQSINVLTSTGKRTADERNITENSADEEVIVAMVPQHSPEGRKRADLKRTPQKPSPCQDVPPLSPLSQVTPPRHKPHQTPPKQWTPDSVSTVYPDNPNHPLHLRGDGPSDNKHEIDTLMSSPRFSPYRATQTGEMEEGLITPTQLEDIYLPHEARHGVNDSTENQVDPCAEPGDVPRSPTPGDKSQPSQARPEEEVNLEGKNEGC